MRLAAWETARLFWLCLDKSDLCTQGLSAGRKCSSFPRRLMSCVSEAASLSLVCMSRCFGFTLMIHVLTPQKFNSSNICLQMQIFHQINLILGYQNDHQPIYLSIHTYLHSSRNRDKAVRGDLHHSPNHTPRGPHKVSPTIHSTHPPMSGLFISPACQCRLLAQHSNE